MAIAVISITDWERIVTSISARIAPFFIALSCVAVLGCSPLRTYEPDTRVVAHIGQERALARLREVVGRAKTPAVQHVDVSDEHLAFEWMDTRHVSRLRFDDIESVDIGRRDHLVTIRMRNQRYIYRLQFTSEADAHELVDLLASFRMEAQGAATAPLSITHDSERI